MRSARSTWRNARTYDHAWVSVVAFWPAVSGTGTEP